MSGVASASGAPNPWLTAAAWRGLFRDRPMIPLLGLLAVLVVISDLVRPGIVSPEWVSVILRAAVLLAILAGCQTLTMLTGGIDLSVGAVASMSGFVVASFAAGAGTPTGIVVALVAAALAGFVTGIGVGVFRVHPLIMTLGTSLIGTGCLQVLHFRIDVGDRKPDVVDRAAGAWLRVFGFLEREDGPAEDHAIARIAVLGAQVRHVPIDSLRLIGHSQMHVVVRERFGPERGRRGDREEQHHAGEQSYFHRILSLRILQITRRSAEAERDWRGTRGQANRSETNGKSKQS